MDKKTAGLSEAMKQKMAPKSFTKKPIQGELKALDNFFKLLGQNSEKSKDVKNEEQE